MEIILSPDKEAQLSRAASARGQEIEAFVKSVISEYLRDEDRIVEAIKAGFAQLDRGEFLTHEEVGRRLDSLHQRG